MSAAANTHWSRAPVLKENPSSIELSEWERAITEWAEFVPVGKLVKLVGAIDPPTEAEKDATGRTVLQAILTSVQDVSLREEAKQDVQPDFSDAHAIRGTLSANLSTAQLSVVNQQSISKFGLIPAGFPQIHAFMKNIRAHIKPVDIPHLVQLQVQLERCVNAGGTGNIRKWQLERRKIMRTIDMTMTDLSLNPDKWQKISRGLATLRAAQLPDAALQRVYESSDLSDISKIDEKLIWKHLVKIQDQYTNASLSKGGDIAMLDLCALTPPDGFEWEICAVTGKPGFKKKQKADFPLRSSARSPPMPGSTTLKGCAITLQEAYDGHKCLGCGRSTSEHRVAKCPVMSETDKTTAMQAMTDFIRAQRRNGRPIAALCALHLEDSIMFATERDIEVRELGITDDDIRRADICAITLDPAVEARHPPGRGTQANGNVRTVRVDADGEVTAVDPTDVSHGADQKTVIFTSDANMDGSGWMSWSRGDIQIIMTIPAREQGLNTAAAEDIACQIARCTIHAMCDLKDPTAHCAKAFAKFAATPPPLDRANSSPNPADVAAVDNIAQVSTQAGGANKNDGDIVALDPGAVMSVASATAAERIAQAMRVSTGRGTIDVSHEVRNFSAVGGAKLHSSSERTMPIPGGGGITFDVVDEMHPDQALLGLPSIRNLGLINVWGNGTYASMHDKDTTITSNADGTTTITARFRNEHAMPNGHAAVKLSELQTPDICAVDEGADGQCRGSGARGSGRC